MPQDFVAKTIIRCGQNYLLIRRSSQDSQRPGEWDIPGGSLNDGEDIRAAAAREIVEETGIAVEPAALKLIYADTRLNRSGDTALIRFVFFAEVADEVVSLSVEHQDSCWVPKDEFFRRFQHPVYIQAANFALDNKLI